MGEDGQMRIIERGENALRHRIAIHAESRMDRSDHVVELVQSGGIVIELSIGEDVGLDSLENAKIREAFVERVDLFVLPEDLVALQSAGIERELGVIRDSDVAPAALPRGLG